MRENLVWTDKPFKVRKKPRQLERKLMVSLWEYLTYKKVFCWVTYQPLLKPGQFKMYHFSSTGVADILGIYKGKPLAIEVKVKTYPTDKQKAFLERFNQSGGIAFIARSIDDIDNFLFKKENFK